jgi:hypothetical protein
VKLVELENEFDDEQVDDLKNLFNEFDESHTGAINVTDLMAVFAKMGNPLTRPKANALILEVDMDGNNEIGGFISRAKAQHDCRRRHLHRHCHLYHRHLHRVHLHRRPDYVEFLQMVVDMKNGTGVGDSKLALGLASTKSMKAANQQHHIVDS